MNPYRLLLVTAVASFLSGCGIFNPNPVPPPVVVAGKQKVNIDPSLLKDCDKPGSIDHPMNQADTLNWMQGEAIKLISCGKNHHALAEDTARAFNLQIPPQ